MHNPKYVIADLLELKPPTDTGHRFVFAAPGQRRSRDHMQDSVGPSPPAGSLLSKQTSSLFPQGLSPASVSAVIHRT